MLWSNKDKISMGVKKARGTLDMVLQMIENDIYCDDIANQINETQALLKEANRQLLKNHLKCCAKTKLVSEDKAEVEEFVDELVRVWDVSTRK